MYEAAGKLVGVSTAKAAWELPAGAPFEDYLALRPPEDDVSEITFDPLNPSTYDPMSARRGDEEEEDAADAGGSSWWGGGSGKGAGGGGKGGSSRKHDLEAELFGGAGGGDDFERFSDAAGGDEDGEAPGPSGRGGGSGSYGASGRPSSRNGPSPAPGGKKGGGGGSKKKKKAGGGRVLRARLWMAQGFPMRLSELVPLLDVIGSANKQISKVGRFMRRYAGLDLFPVKIQVPLLLTIYAVVGFSHFKELAPAAAPAPDFFQVGACVCWEGPCTEPRRPRRHAAGCSRCCVTPPQAAA